MKCPKCGKEIAEDSVYCTYCGCKIQQKKRSFVPWMILIVVVGVCVMGARAFFLYNNFSNHNATTENNNAANIIFITEDSLDFLFEESQSVMDKNEYNAEKEIEQNVKAEADKAKAKADETIAKAEADAAKAKAEVAKAKAEAEKAKAEAEKAKADAAKAKAELEAILKKNQEEAERKDKKEQESQKPKKTYRTLKMTIPEKNGPNGNLETHFDIKGEYTDEEWNALINQIYELYF